MAAKRVKKRRKKSGIVYFAVNNRIPEMVKIGRTIDSAEKRLCLMIARVDIRMVFSRQASVSPSHVIGRRGLVNTKNDVEIHCSLA